jgi:hypothetical protein
MDGDEWDAVPSTKLLSGSRRYYRMPSQVVAICATWQQRRNNKGGDQWEWRRHLTRPKISDRWRGCASLQVEM